MLKRKNAILAGAVMAAIPVAANAATITFSFDLNDILVGTSANGTYVPASQVTGASLTGTAAAPVLTIPVGDYFYFGVDAQVANNNGYGMAAFQLGLTNSTPANATTTPANTSGVPTALTGGPTINAFFSSVQSAGDNDGAGGVSTNLGPLGSYVQSGAGTTKLNYGVTAPQELYSGLRIHATGASGTSDTLTLTSNNTGLQYIVQNTGVVTTAGGSTIPATYKNQTFIAGTDTLSALPALTLHIGAATTPTGHAIVSLVSGSTAQSLYGATLGSITVTGSNATGYNVGSTAIASAPTGGVNTTFTVPPTSGTEVYALKLSDTNGTDDGKIVTDINANSATDGVVASLVTGSAYANEFPGYQILLTADGLATNGLSNLGFDFSQETNVAGVTVTGVAAVPEPATLAGLAIGASGLLLGRRKNRVNA